jgi:hypothetical protein
MPIAKGQDWGEPGILPPGAPIFDGDAQLSRAIQFAEAQGLERPVCGLTGGDLWQTLGAPPGGRERLRDGIATQVVVDVGWAMFDESDQEHAFVAHCVARTRLWGIVLAAMNAEWINQWDVAPKSHPGDGWLDVSDAKLSWGERRKIRRRLPTGTHLPHPDVTTSRVRQAEFEFDRSRRVYLDGAPFPPVRLLKFRLEPASLTVLV